MYSLRSSWAVCEPITSILSQIRISSTGYIPNIPQYSPRFVGQIQFICVFFSLATSFVSGGGALGGASREGQKMGAEATGAV